MCHDGNKLTFCCCLCARALELVSPKNRSRCRRSLFENTSSAKEQSRGVWCVCGERHFKQLYLSRKWQARDEENLMNSQHLRLISHVACFSVLINFSLVSLKMFSLNWKLQQPMDNSLGEMRLNMLAELRVSLVEWKWCLNVDHQPDNDWKIEMRNDNRFPFFPS